MTEAGAIAAINFVLGLFTAGGPISQLIDKARAEGRSISQSEFDILFANDDTARAILVAAIAEAKAEGR